MSQTGIALISLTNNRWAKEKLTDNQNAIELVKQKLDHLSRFSVQNFISDVEPDKSYYQTLFPNTHEVKLEIYPFLEACLKHFNGCDNIIFLYSDSPLNDMDLVQELLTLHENEMAEYSFTENYPEGIGAEILSYNVLNLLKNVASGSNESFNRKSIFKLINFDINRYDVEVLVSERDIRKERLSLLSNDYRNFLIVQSFINELSTPTESGVSDIYSLVDSHAQVMRSVPAYVEIEITNDCNCACVICPRTKQMTRAVTNMSLDQYTKIIDELDTLCNEVHVALSLMGEPTLHPNLMDMIRYTLTKPGLTLILETNGLLLNKDLSDEISSLNSDKLMVIIALDSPKESVYAELRSVDSLKTVEVNSSYLLEKRPKQTYIQILRLKENNEHLDDYYKRWDAYKDQIIIQKYNSYKAELPDRRAADLSPLKRFSCWHLKRDLVILADGTVPFCKQDINGAKSYGNVFSTSVKAIWQAQEQAFVKDHGGTIDPFCDSCDEWFTYNF